jgi:flagellar hook-associated protein 1 FlgK
MVDTTSHNIANSNNEYYTRQRVTVSSGIPIKDSNAGLIGSGVNVEQISRIHNTFVYDRYMSASKDMEYADTNFKYLDEVATYFSDIDETGTFKDIENYFNAWESFAINPTDSSHKIDLAKYTNTFTANLETLYTKIESLQSSINDQVALSIEEFNRMGEKIAEINKKIKVSEINSEFNANDLRDERDKLELSMAKLLNITVHKSNADQNATIDTNMQDKIEHYNLTLGGLSLLNAEEFKPLKLDNTNIANGLYNIKYDFQNTDVTNLITGGKVGALLDLRGHEINEFSYLPADGKLQSYLDGLNSFAKGFVEYSNNVYAKSAQSDMNGKTITYKDSKYQDVNLDANTKLSSIASLNVNTTTNTVLNEQPSFNVIAYDNEGNILASKNIALDSNTTMQSIIDSINSNTDDNGDNDYSNDINDYFEAVFENSQFKLKPKAIATEKEYMISVVDSTTVPSNFAGFTGVSRFLDGDSVKSMSLNTILSNDPLKINAFGSPANGDNEVANSMLQLQYDKKTFYDRFNRAYSTNETINSFYKVIATNVISDTNSISTLRDTKGAIFSTVKAEFDNVSKVSIDEELTNLLKFQASYQANAKVVTTLDELIDTLLGLKR